MKNLSLVIRIVPICAALLCSYARAAEPDYSKGILDRAEALARDITTNDFPDAETVLMAGIEKIAYQEDGTFEQWQEEYIKILTEAGRRDYLTISSYFTIPYQRGPEDCRIDCVEIFHPDGTTNIIDVAGQSRIMVDPSSMEANIYNPNEKLIGLNIGGLEVGDILHYVMFDRIVQPRMARTWCDWFGMESTQPIVRRIVEIDGPTNQPLRSIALKDAVGKTVTATHEVHDGRNFYRWEARDVPRCFPEPNMPELQTVVQRLLVSTCADWETVSKWYWKLSEPHYVVSPEIEAKVAELIKDKTSDAERIRALFGFVAQNIRYMGIVAESESPGYEPHDVRDTFAARHGVCRDKAALLAAMLRAAELPAFPALINSGPKKDTEVAQPYFNHAIVAVRVADQIVLMDPTDETTKELLPSYLDDCSYLVASPEGDPLRVSPIDPASNNLMRIHTTGFISAAGRLSAQSYFEFDGVNDNVYRQYFSRVEDLERRRLFEGVVRRSVPGARVREVELAPENMLDVSTGLIARVAYEADNVLIQGDGLGLMPLPLMGTRLGMVNFIIGQTGLAERRFPLRTGVACGVKEHLSLALDPALNLPLSLPAAPAIDEAGVAWNLAVKQSGPTLDAQSEFRLDTVEFSPTQYLQLKKSLVDIERTLRRMPIFALKSEASDLLTAGRDAVVESEVSEYDVEQDGTWKETHKATTRILTYAGKKQHSEVSVSYNPIWDEVELVSGTVTAPDGHVSEISRAEINIMDAPWVGSAGRYPAERTLVASFPAVEIGSTIAYTLTATHRGRPFCAFRESFRDVDPIRSKRVTLRVPRGRKPAIYRHAFDLVDVQESELRHGTRQQDLYEWSVTDVPGVRREDRMPPDWNLHPTIFVSMGNWADYAAKVNGALIRGSDKQPAAAALARELTKGVTNAWDRLRLIRDTVATRVRPIGPTLVELPLSSITAADRTLADGYGNLADRAVLLHAMLRAAGFDPEFVAASRRPAIGEFRTSLDEAPTPDVFPDVLVRVRGRGLELSDNKYVYMGDDDQYGAVGASAHEGMWALILPDGVIASVLPAREDQLSSEHEMWVEANGDVRMTERRLYFGTAFGAEFRRYSDMTPEERRRYYREMVGMLSESAEPDGELISDFSSYPGRIEFGARLPQYAVRDGEFLYFTFPETLDSLFGLRAETRANPLYVDARGVTKMRGTVHLPPEFEVVVEPADQHYRGLANTRADLQVDVEASDVSTGVCVMVQAEVTRAPAIVPTGDYPALLDWERGLAHLRARTVVLKKKP